MSDGAELGQPSYVDTVAGLHVRCWGNPLAQAVLLSAGLGGSGTYWIPQVAGLARDFYVITYDHRGTGHSDRDPLTSPYRVHAMAEDIRMLLDGLGIPAAHLVGHAAGAVAVMTLAAIASERVLSLAVVNGWARPSRHFSRCMEIRRSILDSDGVDAYLKAQPLFLYPATWIDQNLDRLDAERAAQLPLFQDRATLFARMAALEAFDLRIAQPRTDTEILLVAAEDDALVPVSAAAELQEALPWARQERFAAGGHAINVTEPERFNAMLQSFLS